MNALARLPDSREPPKITAALEAAIAPPRRYVSDVPDEKPYVAPPAKASRMDVQEAKRVLGSYEAWCSPPDKRDRQWQEEVVLWVFKIAAGVGNPPPEIDIRLRASAIADACSDLPRSVWCDATITLGRKEFDWWGKVTAPAVMLLLSRFAADMIAKRDGLRRVATLVIEAPAPSVEEPPADPETITRLAQEAKGILGDYEAMIPPPPKPKALCMSDEALLATYERIAADESQPTWTRGLAETRIATLRKKLGVPD